MPTDIVAGETAMKHAANYGLGVVLAISILAMFFFLLRYVLVQLSKANDNQQRILDTAMEYNVAWQRAIDDHTKQAKEFHDQVTVAHRSQREEHDSFAKLLKCMMDKVDDCDKRKS